MGGEAYLHHAVEGLLSVVVLLLLDLEIESQLLVSERVLGFAFEALQHVLLLENLHDGGHPRAVLGLGEVGFLPYGHDRSKRLRPRQDKLELVLEVLLDGVVCQVVYLN